jgi:predicted DsbA family dithiol-disulfide isomerase
MSDSETLLFFYDYVDPVSFVLKRRLEALVKTTDLAMEALPMELNPPPASLLDPEGKEYASRWGGVDALGSPVEGGLRRPWIVPWTRKAHELAFHARQEDRFEEIHEALFRAYLIDGRDIGRIDLLVEIAGSAGLDPMEVKAVLDVDKYRDAVEEARVRGLDAGCTSPPALKWKERVIAGSQEPEALRRLLSGLSEQNPEPVE